MDERTVQFYTSHTGRLCFQVVDFHGNLVQAKEATPDTLRSLLKGVIHAVGKDRVKVVVGR